jgi:polysaccharide deacetylase family protein (PEP-CTERM system associated)
MPTNPIRNALTIDVEDYFHVSAFAGQIGPSDWGRFESRVERNTQRLLDILDEHECKATFFVLGWVAEKYSPLVREIAARGHEVACHGYSHQLIYEQTPEVFQRETRHAKALLEDIVQAPVYGYRAASFSITSRSKWAFEVLAELGFVYDSSVFPIHHDRYGLPDTCHHPHRLTLSGHRTLVEFPLSTVGFSTYRFPVGGGGYFRLYPYQLTRWLLGSINRRGEPFVFYLHPWEIDPGQPRVCVGRLSTFRHYTNLATCEARFKRLLTEFSLTTMKGVLQELSLWDGLSLAAEYAAPSV